MERVLIFCVHVWDRPTESSWDRPRAIPPRSAEATAAAAPSPRPARAAAAAERRPGRRARPCVLSSSSSSFPRVDSTILFHLLLELCPGDHNCNRRVCTQTNSLLPFAPIHQQAWRRTHTCTSLQTQPGPAQRHHRPLTHPALVCARTIIHTRRVSPSTLRVSETFTQKLSPIPYPDTINDILLDIFNDDDEDVNPDDDADGGIADNDEDEGDG